MKKLFLVLIAAISISLTACQADQSKSPSVQDTTTQNEYGITVTYNNQSTFFNLDKLNNLPLQSVNIAGRMQEGPLLSDILKAAGIKEYSSVTIESKDSEITLQKGQIDNKTIVDFTHHGTVKLASPNIEKPKWVKDITKIEVK